MCGIAGLFPTTGRGAGEPRAAAMRMAEALRHRGPDDTGTWTDATSGLAFAHRRLAVVDLSSAGHQPMHSPSSRFTVIFNGEIYNHLAIRAELGSAGAAPVWRGHSDTETLLAAFERWGVEQTLRRTVGMFALAVWDATTRTLQLARDRFGEKPLYYGWVEQAFVFASELKALRACPGFHAGVSPEALRQYLRFLYVPAPHSIHENVYKLEPGCLLTIQGTPPARAPSAPVRPGNCYENLSMHRWWSVATAMESAAAHPFTDEHEATEMLASQLSEAIRLQSIADVQLGAFLSGGVDSSTIVALMQQQSSQRVRTFTVAFEDAVYDESRHARAVANHLGTVHSELTVTAEQARAVIPLLPDIYDEPFADSSQIPTYLVCRAARQQVTVALSGDAGDELFGGYNRYLWGPALWRRVAWAPHPLRVGIAHTIRTIPSQAWDSLGGVVNVVRKRSGGVLRLGQKAHRFGSSLAHAHSMSDLYANFVSEWQDTTELLGGGGPEPRTLLSDELPAVARSDETLRMMYWDAITYLPDDILCKVDRAAMAISLETRAPFLDHRVAELAWKLPMSMKIRGSEGKWALRQVLYRHVPRTLIERPKTGFGIPLGDWLRGPLRPWAEDLLEASRLRRDGYFRPEPVMATWRQHLSGSYDWTGRLWAILMFQAWLAADR